MKTRPLRAGPGLVHEEEAARVRLVLTLEPGLARCLYVFPVLLRGVRGLFLRVMP
mgnify:CR=1 FL=1